MSNDISLQSTFGYRLYVFIYSIWLYYIWTFIKLTWMKMQSRGLRLRIKIVLRTNRNEIRKVDQMDWFILSFLFFFSIKFLVKIFSKLTLRSNEILSRVNILIILSNSRLIFLGYINNNYLHIAQSPPESKMFLVQTRVKQSRQKKKKRTK